MIQRIGPQQGPQYRFLTTHADICFYGGAAGGGKTYALLMDPMRHFHNPGFGGVIFRRTSPQITNEGGLWDESMKLYPLVRGRPKSTTLQWFFPSGAKMKFSHMEHEENKLNWQGSQIPFIGFDEITHFTYTQFMYMLSRSRSSCGVRPYIRGTCNPDPDSWVRKVIDWWIGPDGYPIAERSGVIRYFVVVDDEWIWADTKKELRAKYGDECDPKSFTFIASSLFDNKALMEQDPGYLANLKALPKVERERLLGGNWDIRPAAGMYFQRGYFRIVDAPPARAVRVRSWDLAATEKTPLNDPDWTVGVKMSRCLDTGLFFVEHVERGQWASHTVKRVVRNFAEQDGKTVRIRLSQDPGQAGKAQAEDFIRDLAGWRVRAVRETGDKITRAGPVSAQAEAGNICLVRGPWNEPFLRVLEAFGEESEHDDDVDAFANAFHELTTNAVDYEALTRM